MFFRSPNPRSVVEVNGRGTGRSAWFWARKKTKTILMFTVRYPVRTAERRCLDDASTEHRDDRETSFADCERAP